MQIPIEERSITDEQFFSALNLDYPGLCQVKDFYRKGELRRAKCCLLRYFETRSQVRFLFDYRMKPITPIDTDSVPYSFQASLGLKGSLKEFCLYAGRKMMDYIYVIPGKGRGEIPLGSHFSSPLHFSFLRDQGVRRNHLNLFVRGTSFEYLYVLYHETGDRKVLERFDELLDLFFHTYPLVVCNTQADAARFQFEDDRDVMSAGFLALTYIGMLYTRVPYELDPEKAFEILKHLWFLGIQFRRFDRDSYRPYNHHMWERGLVPFILGTMFPEIPDFAPMKAIGASVICRHIKEDFNEDGGYSEHSIAYWAGAALGEMLYRGIRLARLNCEPLLDEESARRLAASFQVLAQITPPGKRYPSLGDNHGPEADPLLSIGVLMLDHMACREVLDIRTQKVPLQKLCHVPLDYCSDRAGFVCGKSGYGPDSNYILMSAKNNCGYTGHNHMDMLSLFLTLRGVPIFDEPDSGLLYHNVRMASPQRGYMYNMGAHNTVLAFGSPIASDDMYADSWGVYRPDSPVTNFVSLPEGMFVEACHGAYTFCLHRRRILFHRRRGVVIQDCIDRGNRYPKSHIQRWHLAKGIRVTPLNKSALLLKSGQAEVLCLWDRPEDIRVFPDRLPYPEIISDADALSTVVDVSFRGKREETLDYATTSLTLLCLDVTGIDAGRLDSDGLMGRAVSWMEDADITRALKAFDTLNIEEESIL